MSPQESAWLILPTYNERENLEPFVAAVRPVLAGCTPDHTILIVDDSSPDGTGEIADRLAATLDDVKVLHRPRKEGLGPAYLAGFAVALDRGATLIMEMDSDFSHRPEDISRLLTRATQADLVIGSRYVPGGGVTDWGPARRFVSRAGCWYARKLLGVSVRDLTGGFKCFRRKVLESLDFEKIHSLGYAFQVEMTYRAVRKGFRVAEIPIVFSERRVGHSKMSRRIVLEAVWVVPRLRLSRI